MLIRAYRQNDLAPLTELTIATFRPFYEDTFRPLVGEFVFANQHGAWRDDYREELAGLHAPDRHAYVAVAEAGDAVAGYVAWTADPARRNGTITHLAVAPDHRRRHTGTALCDHAFDHLRAVGAEVVQISTGGDPFHAPARALYESLGCTPLPLVSYTRRL